MSLQNRVDPFGSLVSTPARGAWMGNRGVLHDQARMIRRPWRLKAWLICRLEFNGRYRAVMSPHRYTELFFLDEATALAAGHRPCFECRRSAYMAFKSAAGLGSATAGEMDAALQVERLGPNGAKRTFIAELSDLPDGAFVKLGGQPWLKRGDVLHRWTEYGYAEQIDAPGGEIEVLTPALSITAIRGGYRPQCALDGDRP